MKVECKLYSSLERRFREKRGTRPPLVFDLAENTTVSNLLADLDVPLASVKLIFVNGIHRDRDTILREGDRVGVFPPVAGG